MVEAYIASFWACRYWPHDAARPTMPLPGIVLLVTLALREWMGGLRWSQHKGNHEGHIHVGMFFSFLFFHFFFRFSCPDAHGYYTT